jgi:hypothetical protein
VKFVRRVEKSVSAPVNGGSGMGGRQVPVVDLSQSTGRIRVNRLAIELLTGTGRPILSELKPKSAKTLKPQSLTPVLPATGQLTPV